MKIYIVVTVLAVLIIIVVRALIICCIKFYFVHKAKKMTDMELVEAQIKEWEPGWFHELKYEIYRKAFDGRPKVIPPSDID